MFETKYDKEIVEFALSTAVSSKDRIIQVLSEQVQYLEQQVKNERRRAELAIDALLAQKNIPPVMPEKFDIPSEEERRARRARSEMAAAALKSELEKIGDTGTAPDEPVDGKARSEVEEIV